MSLLVTGSRPGARSRAHGTTGEPRRRCAPSPRRPGPLGERWRRGRPGGQRRGVPGLTAAAGDVGRRRDRLGRQQRRPHGLEGIGHRDEPGLVPGGEGLDVGAAGGDQR